MSWVVAGLILLVLIFLLVPIDSDANSSEPRRTTTRMGKTVAVDEVFDAWTEGDLEDMLAVLDMPTNPVDRHYLLLRIVKETYSDRDDPKMRQLCREVAELHLSEMDEILPALRKDQGFLPRIPTFQHYATVLTEDGEYDAAVEVCETALDYGLDDGTKTGFEGRIERIRRKQEKME